VGAHQRRRTGWEEGPGIQDAGAPVSISGSSSQILGTAQAATTDGLTIVRTRGIIELVQKTATAAGDGFVGAFGIGIASAAAIAVGVTAVPTPITEVEWDGWLYHQFFSVHSFGAQATLDTGGLVPVRVDIDSKAMRKLDSQEAVYLAFEFVVAGTASMSVFATSRMLLKLP